MRFAYRPLMEIPFSLRVLADTALQAPHRRWVEEAQRALYGTEMPYLDALVPANSQHIPHFLTPTPLATSVNIEDDIAELLATPDDLVRKCIHKLIAEAGGSEMRSRFLTHPHEAMQHLADELRLYSARALAPYRSQMVSIKEGDVLFRARMLALEGPGSLFDDLHPGMNYRLNRLEIKPGSPFHSHHGAHADTEFRLNGEGIQLVPTIFAHECHLQIAPEWRPRLSFPVRGVGLWDSTPANKSLELMLGIGRARVLQALTTPASTSELARRLSLSSGAVSQQLNLLKRAGMVKAHRSGKWVYYQLTAQGETLISLFERIA
jgi:DNA-binding transcriptional ArsR family regulator